MELIDISTSTKPRLSEPAARLEGAVLFYPPRSRFTGVEAHRYRFVHCGQEFIQPSIANVVAEKLTYPQHKDTLALFAQYPASFPKHFLTVQLQIEGYIASPRIGLLKLSFMLH